MTATDELAQNAGRYELSHLRALEAEAIHIIREVAAEFERPVLLFSGGKDSIVMLHLAIKAFRPGRLPFPVMHVDTGHNFDEVLQARDELVAESGVRLVVAKVQDDIDAGRVVETIPSRNPMQTFTLLRAIRENKFDAAFGGARRDEEKARAKERVFSFRDEFGQWDPKNQRPELWNLYNGRHRKGEHIRAFPLSNWTEFDIWSYIGAEKIKLPSIYYAHQRKVFERDGMLLAVHRYLQPRKDEPIIEKTVRFRTVGDVACTGCVESTAATVSEVIAETAISRLTERGAPPADDGTPWSAVVSAGEPFGVHDPLCPMTPPAFIAHCVSRAVEGACVVVGVRPVTDTVKVVADGLVGETVDRDGLVAVASPVVLPPEVVASMDELPTHDLVELVAALRSRYPVELVEAPPAARRVGSEEDVRVLEALTVDGRPGPGPRGR